MISEFEEVRSHSVHEALPPLARLLSTPQQGLHASGSISSADLASNHTVSIGMHRHPEVFMQEALSLGHPTLVHSLFPKDMAEVISYCKATSPRTLAMERTAELRRWAFVAEQTVLEERELKKGLCERKQEILEKKNITLFRQLLADCKHDDITLVDDFIKGFDLTGCLPESGVFGKKFRPAVLSRDGLRKVAEKARTSMLSSVGSSGDPELDRGLFAATLAEEAFCRGLWTPTRFPGGRPWPKGSQSNRDRKFDPSTTIRRPWWMRR